MKLSKKEVFILFALCLIVFSIIVKILINFPFLLLNKDSLNYKTEQGWIRYVKTTGRFPIQKIEFNYNNKTVLLVCGDNMVSVANCNIVKNLEQKMISGKSYSQWEKAELTISKLNIPIVSFLDDFYLLKE